MLQISHILSYGSQLQRSLCLHLNQEIADVDFEACSKEMYFKAHVAQKTCPHSSAKAS